MNERYYLQRIQFRYLKAIRCEALIFFTQNLKGALIGVCNGLSGIVEVSDVEVVNEYPDVDSEFIRNENNRSLAPVSDENRLKVFLRVYLRKTVGASDGIFENSLRIFNITMTTDNPLNFKDITPNHDLLAIEVSI